MPYKNRQKYREYQKAYYRKRKQSTIGSNPTRGLSPGPKTIQGLTARQILNPAITPAVGKPSNSIPQNQRVTPATASSKGDASTPLVPSIPSIPVNPAKTKLPSSGIISEGTRRHVEKLREEGWEIDDVGNAHRKP